MNITRNGKKIKDGHRYRSKYLRKRCYSCGKKIELGGRWERFLFCKSCEDKPEPPTTFWFINIFWRKWKLLTDSNFKKSTFLR